MNTNPKEKRKHWFEFKVLILKEYVSYQLTSFDCSLSMAKDRSHLFFVTYLHLHIFRWYHIFVTHIPVWYAHIIIVHFMVNYLINLAIIHDVVMFNLMAKMCLMLPSVTLNSLWALFGKAYNKSSHYIIVRRISIILYGLCIAIAKSMDV